MADKKLEGMINDAWEKKEEISVDTKGPISEAILHTLDLLGEGSIRVAEPTSNGKWKVNEWTKKAVLLSFRLNAMSMQKGGPQDSAWWDEIDSKFLNWSTDEWKNAGFRAVPNCIVRKSAYIGQGVVLMPSFVNLGAYVDTGTMVDTWATVGSCAQIGKNVHLSGGVGIKID